MFELYSEAECLCSSTFCYKRYLFLLQVGILLRSKPTLYSVALLSLMLRLCPETAALLKAEMFLKPAVTQGKSLSIQNISVLLCITAFCSGGMDSSGCVSGSCRSGYCRDLQRWTFMRLKMLCSSKLVKMKHIWSSTKEMNEIISSLPYFFSV